MAYYNEPVTTLAETISQVKSTFPYGSTTRVTLYAKGPDNKNEEYLKGLLGSAGVDEVIALENLGREGETYLVSDKIEIASSREGEERH